MSTIAERWQVHVRKEKENLTKPPAVLNCVWIPLTRNQFALIDEIDAVEVLKMTWYALSPKTSPTYYAATHTNGKCLLLHKFIANRMDMVAFRVDHKNRNCLDCRRQNLRAAGKGQNQHNAVGHKDNRSGLKGVSKHGPSWRFSLTLPNDEVIRQGRFKSPQDAADAYDSAALQYFGEFALTNKMLRETVSREIDLKAFYLLGV